MLAFVSSGHQGPFNEGVVEGAGQPCHIAVSWKPVESIGQVRRNFRFPVRWKEGEVSIGCSFARIIGNARFETDGDDGVGSLRERVRRQQNRVGGPVLNDGVSKQIVHSLGNGFGRRFCIDEVAAYRTHAPDGNGMVCVELATNNVASNVPHSFPLTRRDFNPSDWHALHRARRTSRCCSMRSL